MLLKNGYIAMASSVFGCPSNEIISYSGAAWAIDCSIFLADIYSAYSMYNSIITTTPTSGKVGVVFGTGNTPVTLNDYKLSGDVVSTISVTRKTTTSGTAINHVYTITNSGDSAITISEVGLVNYTTQINLSGGGSSSNYKNSFLMERTVLDSPVTIQPGAVGQVTYNISFNLPT